MERRTSLSSGASSAAEEEQLAPQPPPPPPPQEEEEEEAAAMAKVRGREAFFPLFAYYVFMGLLGPNRYPAREINVQ
jgi:hypothetical protein